LVVKLTVANSVEHSPLEKALVLNLEKTFYEFCATRGSAPCLQESVTGSYP